MEDVVAVAIELTDGSLRYVLAWGRILARTEPAPLEAVVAAHAPRRFALGGELRRTRLCGSLREAAESASASYFFEHLWWFAAHPIPFGPDYEAWRAEREVAQLAGRELLYCGRPWDPT